MNEYNRVEQFLHRVVLEKPAVGELLFDIEKMLFGKKAKSQQPTQPVFIAGLARAGTTVLMRSLYSSGEFASLTYDDMPFVMAPNLWRKLSKWDKKKRTSSERAHGDRILVDADSPEALEEVFWRTMHGDDYIKPQVLIPHAIPERTLGLFCIYQALVCKRYRKERYLSKNNNNLLRLNSLVRHFPEAYFLVPFRDPMAQAQSLLKQHERFCDVPSFVSSYMEYLAHHEFGTTHRPFAFSSKDQGASANTMEYWLERWVEAYEYVQCSLGEGLKNIIPICYERLCSEPLYLQLLCHLIGISVETKYEFINISPPVEQTTEPTLRKRAYDIYHQLSGYNF